MYIYRERARERKRAYICMYIYIAYLNIHLVILRHPTRQRLKY